MNVSPFDHPFLSGLLGDQEVASLFSAESELAALVAFEMTLAEVEAEFSVIPSQAGTAIAELLSQFSPDMAKLRTATCRDGVVIPELVRQLRAAVGETYADGVHFGVTSQDAIDTALMIRLKAAIDILDERLVAIIDVFASLNRRFGSNEIMGRTRMQAALEISVSDRIRSWQAPLVRHLDQVVEAKTSLLMIQLGGAVGTLEKLGDKGASIRARVASKLGLTDGPAWQNQRDRLAALANLLSLITGSLGKFGQDIALLAQAGDEISLAGGGGSSAMAHKKNPVAAEVLVTLARFNAVQLSGMHIALVHEQERSGSAWALEWLVLPQMVVAAGAALRVAIELSGNISYIGAKPHSL